MTVRLTRVHRKALDQIGLLDQRMTRLLIFGLILKTLAVAPVAGSEPFDETLFYRDYNQVLRDYVNPEGLVDYSALQHNRLPLDHFVQRLGSADPSGWDRSSQTAFWINAYNALTLRVIIDNYPIRARFLASLLYPAKSIRQIDGVWTKIEFRVADETLTLDEIEHSILRRRFREPRIHMALVCAALGCPQLRREAYTGTTLEKQLEEQVTRFLADESQLRIDPGQHRVALSSILKWFAKDFVSSYLPAEGSFPGHPAEVRAVLHFIASRVEPEKERFLRSGEFVVSYLEYDWTLNEQ